MNIEDLTLKQIREIQSIHFNEPAQTSKETTKGLNGMIGQKVIIRTYSAGAWFGTLSEKSGNEVILTNARRMWRWWAKEGISLSIVNSKELKNLRFLEKKLGFNSSLIK